MKKTLLSLAMCLFAGLSFAQSSYTLSFVGYDSDSSDSGSQYEKSQVSNVFTETSVQYVASVDSVSNVYAARTTSKGVVCGCKFGSSKNAGYLAFTLKEPTEVDKIVISAAMYGDAEGGDGFKVGDQTITLSAGNKTFEECTLTPTGTVSQIIIEQVKAAKGRFYMNGITVYPKGSAAAINTVETSNSNETPAYNVAGQRVNANAKGIIIRNGKKYMK